MTSASSSSGANTEEVGVGRALWAGLAPGVLAVLVLAIAIALAALARILGFPLGFLTWRWLTLGIWGAGILIAAIVYSVAARRALRRRAEWRDAELTEPTTAVTVGLVISALLLLLPVILAVALPQHPAS